MGIAFLTLADLFMPLHSLASRWMPTRRSSHRSAGLRYVAVRPACTVRPATSTGAAAAARPLRVTRGSGRVVISGRMADVCEELERLAALEAADEARRLMH